MTHIEKRLVEIESSLNDETGFPLTNRDATDLAFLVAALRLCRTALFQLTNEADGFLSHADPMTHGITNMQVFNLRINESKDCLAALERLAKGEGEST
jgi:hypothetical protein